jgi:cytochrome d ubiquinol oxidase subunit II
MTLDLPVIFGFIIAFSIFMYVLMDGFSLGVGILFPWAPSDEDRDTMMNSTAPIWDGNQTWLVLGGGGLLAAFPLAYSVILPALYLPILVMLNALIFRGVAFEFRFKAKTSRYLWDHAFYYGAVIATVSQGIVLGAFIQGIHVEGGQYAGGAFDWLTPFSIFVSLGLVFGYGLLGATWLILKTEGKLQEWAYACSRQLLYGVLFFMAMVSLITPILDDAIAARWFSWPNIAFLSPVPLAVVACGYALYRAIDLKKELSPFLFTLGLFSLGFMGLGISLWPKLIPPDITIWEAAAAPESQSFLLVGVVVLIPVILGYTAYSYWVFRGKVKKDLGYH